MCKLPLIVYNFTKKNSRKPMYYMPLVASNARLAGEVLREIHEKLGE